MIRVGITGGIGSGKSYVARMLAIEYGIPVYDCDSRAKRLMADSGTIRSSLAALLGEGYTKQDIAAYLFASAGNAARINAIVHPEVKADFLRWAAAQQQEVVAIESAILIESGFTDVVDCVVVVTAPKELRVQRTMQRDACLRTEVERRMAAQMPDEERLRHAHHVVVNDGQPLCLDDVVRQWRAYAAL